MSIAVRSFPERDDAAVVPVLRRVNESYKTARENHHDFSKLHEAVMQLENLLFSIQRDGLDAGTILQEIPSEMLVCINEAYDFWQSRIEEQFVQQFLQDGLSLQEYFLYDRFSMLVDRELKLIAGTELQRILFIGNGALPMSPYLFHSATGVPVDCVARDSSAVDIARKVLERCGVGAVVTVLGGPSLKDNLQDYDLIVIEASLKPRRKVLNFLRKRCRGDCRILCRTLHNLSQLIYESASERDRRGFHLKAQQLGEALPMISTWLLEVAGAAAVDVRLEWLRSVEPNTGRKLVGLMNRTLEEETTIGFPGPIDDHTGSALMAQLNKDVATGHRHVLVAYKGDDIVGQLILTPNASPNHRHIVELTRGVIDPSFRGGGLVLRAFQEVAKKCEELRREVICLDVRAGTHAALWWQHFGFQQYGLLADYSRVGEKRYQGLYLTQTTEELKERLRQLQG
jgi:predicted GNAT family N-acyltransferase